MTNDFLISKVENAHDLELPKYQTSGSAGADLCANVTECVIIKPGEYKAISTGIRIAIPPDYEAQIRPRSGLAAKFGVTTLNSPGTVDSDYRGEIKVILINHGSEDFEVARGDRIAQMVIAKILCPDFKETDDLPNTKRGSGGFGHTGHSNNK
ncbi:MAG: dUTP diphosphatase [Defluviitaleaceae bacterium]|nr:dUTP diphosphatase [Defluviitaleaceae bacterium]